MVVSTLNPTPVDPYRIFPAAHNWAGDYSVAYEYLTDIITSGNGKEQRRAVRNYPRLTTSGTAVYHGEAKLLMDYYFAAWQPYRSIAPLEHLGLRTTAAMAPEAGSVDFAWSEASAPPWVIGGDTVIIRHGLRPGVMETRTVGGVSPGTISFQDDSLTEFPPGSTIFPTVQGWGKLKPVGSRRSNDVGTMSYSFEVDPTLRIIYPGELDITYVGGKELMSKKPNWRENVDVSFIWDRQPIDYNYGAIGNPVNFSFPSRITKATYLARDRVEAWSAMNFFMRHQGRRMSFFAPTFEDDIPYTALSGGGLAVLIDGTAFAYTYMNSTVHRRITLRMIDGTYSHHVVDYIEALPEGVSVMWLTDALPVLSLTPETVRGISWCLNSRFATDEQVFVFPSNEVAEFSMSVMSLENFEI